MLKSTNRFSSSQTPWTKLFLKAFFFISEKKYDRLFHLTCLFKQKKKKRKFYTCPTGNIYMSFRCLVFDLNKNNGLKNIITEILEIVNILNSMSWYKWDITTQLYQSVWHLQFFNSLLAQKLCPLLHKTFQSFRMHPGTIRFKGFLTSFRWHCGISFQAIFEELISTEEIKLFHITTLQPPSHQNICHDEGLEKVSQHI